MEFLKNPSFDFLAKTRLFVPLSALLVLGALALMLTEGLRYGVEFSGGTQLIVKFSSQPEIDQVRAAVESEAPGAIIQTYDDPARNEVLIRVADVGTTQTSGEEEELGAIAERTLKALASNYTSNPVLESSAEIVGPIVGAELRRKAVQLTVLALVFQLIYIAFRFKGPVWGSGATIAAVHDVLITLGVLTVVGYEITLNVIAALLTIVGYSVNDTIVIFDRARENLRQRRREPFPKVINDSINQTLSRTLITSGTTFLAVLGLHVFGGEVLRGFAFTMVVGVVVGTYSTIYVATPLVVWWRERGHKPKRAARAAL